MSWAHEKARDILHRFAAQTGLNLDAPPASWTPDYADTITPYVPGITPPPNVTSGALPRQVQYSARNSISLSALRAAFLPSQNAARVPIAARERSAAVQYTYELGGLTTNSSGSYMVRISP